MRNYFIRYNPEANINYIYLFMLYGISEYDKSSWSYKYITFTTKQQISNRLKDKYKDKALSYSTLTRIMTNKEYNNYFTVDSNRIILNNCFTNNANTDKVPFIILTDKEADFFIKQGDNKLARYYCYIKYYYGLLKKSKKKLDFTAKQFLSSIGLSANNHNNLSIISSYNRLLVNNGFIKIDKYKDQSGYERNIYTIL